MFDYKTLHKIYWIPFLNTLAIFSIENNSLWIQEMKTTFKKQIHDCWLVILRKIQELFTIGFIPYNALQVDRGARIQRSQTVGFGHGSNLRSHTGVHL